MSDKFEVGSLVWITLDLFPGMQNIPGVLESYNEEEDSWNVKINLRGTYVVPTRYLEPRSESVAEDAIFDLDSLRAEVNELKEQVAALVAEAYFVNSLRQRGGLQPRFAKQEDTVCFVLTVDENLNVDKVDPREWMENIKLAFKGTPYENTPIIVCIGPSKFELGRWDGEKWVVSS